MMYVTLKDKIDNLAKLGKVPIPLPIEILKNIAGETPLSYFVNTAPFSARDMCEKYSLDKVTGFFLEFYEGPKRKLSQNTYVTFENEPKKIIIHIEDTDYFNIKLLQKRYKEVFFERLSPGDLGITLLPSTFLKEDFADFLMTGFETCKWDITLPEGSLVTVLEKVKVDSSSFVKVIYDGKIYWIFGYIACLDDIKYLEETFHYI